MKLQKILLVVSVMFVLVSTVVMASASDFDWLTGLNVKAMADPLGFRARLAARFHIGDAEIDAVISNVDRPADAYMVLRFGEMCARPPHYVLEQYKANKGKGWGALAHSLGIKPGSREFHALKRGDDLYHDRDRGKAHKPVKGKKKPARH